jgi:hypothetical protein
MTYSRIQKKIIARNTIPRTKVKIPKPAILFQLNLGGGKPAFSLLESVIPLYKTSTPRITMKSKKIAISGIKSRKANGTIIPMQTRRRPQ